MKTFLTVLTGLFFMENASHASEETVILRLDSDSLSAAMVEEMIEVCTGNQDLLSINNISTRKKDQFEIVLNEGYVKETDCQRERLFTYFITSVLPGNEPLNLKVVNGSPTVLIGDIRAQTIDLKDLMIFNTPGRPGQPQLCAGQILFHELYELYHLVHIQKVKPKMAADEQLAWAHSHATQKESNLYGDNVVKVASELLRDSIFIKFSSRLNNEYSIYHAYHRNGNVYRVDLNTGSD